LRTEGEAVGLNHLLSVQAVMLLAFVSSLSRAGLNIVDRHQIGLQRLSIIQLNLWNNVFPAVAMSCVMVLFFDAGKPLLGAVFDWRTAAFSALVQMVAYSFSHAFRDLNVNQVTVAGKFADLFIPIGIFLGTRQWSWGTYAFSIATTLVCLPMLWAEDRGQRTGTLKTSGAIICVALTLQASLSPLLLFKANSESIVATLVFSTAVMVWRAIWSLIPHWWTWRVREDNDPFAKFRPGPLFIVRALLTVTTQVTFIVAIGSTASAVAWPILNSTGVISMVLSLIVLKERGRRLEYVVVMAIGGLALLRFLTY
jgi:hypothetical protein